VTESEWLCSEVLAVGGNKVVNESPLSLRISWENFPHSEASLVHTVRNDPG
jgi:hypothetical protein